MSKVSTRPQNTEAPPVAPVATPRKNRLQHSQTQRARCDALSTLLNAASLLEDGQELCGNSTRLLRIASGVAAGAACSDWSGPDPEDIVFDVAALLSAAQRVPGDVASPQRESLIAGAWEHLSAMVDGTRADIDDALFMKQPLPAAVPALPNAKALQDVQVAMEEARAVLWAAAPESPTEIVWGAAYLLDQQAEALQKAIGTADMQQCEDVSAPMGVAMAVLDAAIEKYDHAGLRAAASLLRFAKNQLDRETYEAVCK